MSSVNVNHIIKRRNAVSLRASQLPASGIRKFFDLLSSMDGVISLGVGEPDFVTPWHIREAAIYSIEKGYTMYTSNRGMPELRQAISAYLKSHFGLSYNPDTELLVTVGVSEALDLATRAILDPEDEVIIADPSYVAYPACITLAGGVPVAVPTRAETGFQLNPSSVESRVTSNTKAILLGYPANPTGAVMSRSELTKICQVARKHNLLVISDEVYARLVYGVEHTCIAALPDMKERAILLGGFSKAFAMTGWRVGYAAARPDIIEAMTRIHQYTMLCASITGQVAALEALNNGEKEVQQMVMEYDRRRRFMVGGLNNIGLACPEPQGAFYCFPSIKDTGLSSEEFAEKLLIEEKVAVVPGSAFGPSGKGHIRCCYATSLTDIEEALKRMGKFVDRFRK